MNITTGGPHILLFERDQQLASLLTSELQLAGYECHVARTAVEVFDAIARHSIRLLLVNLAQAAAARREFWVALDTQRRGRGVQVLTFLCMNVAGYGPKDPDDVPQSVTIDIEVDGMIGLMSLVEAVRSRLPSTTSTAPTMLRVLNTPASSPVTSANPAPSIPPSGGAGETLLRSISPSNAPSYQSAMRPGISPTGPQPVAMNFQASPQQPLPTYNSNVAPAQEQANGGVNPAAYTDRIRAVLYPNQRAWSTNNSPLPPETRLFQENQIQQGPTMNAPRQESMPPYMQSPQSQNGVDSNLSTNTRSTSESGLDQLTRLIQQYQSSSPGAQAPQQQPPVTPLQQPPSSGLTPFGGSLSQQFAPPFHGSQTGMPQQSTTNNQAPGSITQFGVTPPQPVVPPESVSLNTQTMRAAPIQDLPSERQFTPETQRGMETPPRPGSSIQQSSGPIPPLASITTPPMQPDVASTPMQTIQASPTREPPRPGDLKDARPFSLETPGGTASGSSAEQDQETIIPVKKLAPGEKQPGMTSSQEETLIGIMESLPPMPPSTKGQSQAAQQYVMNGRAMRSLGSVLLAGHLVPEDRLDVAQNIQRMLRGVDLNYQLGEILLMFKLLTPDQLMAASLVSYGMVSTQQISALGRIRQELHSVGLDYDLENLLILFRILTPEQIREAKSAWQS